MNANAGYVLEDAPEGRSLVVTGPWSAEPADALRRGDADRLVLNYARGFGEGDLDFLDGSLAVRRLKLLHREISDLAPIERLGGTLEDLSVQAAPDAQLDLASFPRLRSVAGAWRLIGATLGAVDALENVVTWEFEEADLHAFRDHVGLRRLTIKESPHLESLSGVGDLPELEVLGVFLGRRLGDIDEVAGLAASLRELELEDCPGISTIDAVEPLVSLRFLGISECGDIESLAPVESLEQLEEFHAWGSTRVVDGDLSPLGRLPRLKEIRMRDRRGYEPRVADLVSALPA
jgi:hypothetical protein